MSKMLDDWDDMGLDARRGALSKDSLTIWEGAVFPAGVRVIDLTVLEDRPEVFTVILEPVREPDAPLSSEEEPMLEALLEWGSSKGRHAAKVDVGRGQSLVLAASRLIVTVRTLSDRAARGAQVARVRASATMGSVPGLPRPRRMLALGALARGSTTGAYAIPGFARGLSVAVSPAETVLVDFFGADGARLAQAIWPVGHEHLAAVPPSAARFTVTNTGARDLARVGAVFELAL